MRIHGSGCLLERNQANPSSLRLGGRPATEIVRLRYPCRCTDSPSGYRNSMRLTALHRGTGDAASERVISEAEGGARVPTILVIEDRPVDRKLLTLVLRSGGNDVVEASDGEEALEIIQRDDVDLVISDIL